MFRYEIVGALAGPIWQPGFDDCRKEVNETFTRTVDPIHTQREAMDLREMVERITNDGDFQSCKLTADSFLRVIQVKSGNGWRDMHEHTYDLTKFPSIADYVDKDKFMLFEEEWEDE